MQTKQNWWRDECGLILSAELVIILTVVVIGLITGLACVQQAVVGELQDIGGAFRQLNQSYAFTGFRGCPKIWGRTSWTAGSAFYNRVDGCVNGNCVNGDCSIGVGTGCVGCPTVIEPGVPQAAPVVPKVQTTVPCPNPPCNPVVPEVRDPNCQTCQPLPGPAVPVPMPEIPQGPVPQSLPQL
ncbi:MAG TPA: hypothetical protein VFG20_16475 [Planctomycetaceae bacterium]|nr:hypothetical protein [Planctomycetaceae bacterium]